MILPTRGIQWLVLLLLVFLVIFARAPAGLTLPTLEVEDGSSIFAHFYQNRGIEQVFREKGGYVPLVANMIGFFSVRLPTRAIPYGLTWLPLLITMTAYGLFFSRRYRCVLASDRTRAVVCLLFCLAPLSQFHLLSHTDYSTWNTLLLLILMSALPLPSGRTWGIPYWLLLNMLIWSHPLTILILPFQVSLLVRDKPRRALYALTIINLVMHQVLGVEGARIFADLGPLGIGLKVAKSAVWTLVIASKTAFRAAFGHPLLVWAEEHMWLLIVCWTAFLSIATGIVFWRRPSYRSLILTVLYFIFSVTFLNVLSRGYAVAGNIDYSPRYVYIQSLSFLVLFVGLADAFIRSRPDSTQFLARAERSDPTRACVTASIATACTRATVVFSMVILHYFLLNTQLGHCHVVDTKPWNPYLDSHPDNGAIVARFFRDLAQAETENGGRAGIWLVAKKIRDWPIEIDTRTDGQRKSIE